MFTPSLPYKASSQADRKSSLDGNGFRVLLMHLSMIL
jgi:hypothetical protein